MNDFLSELSSNRIFWISALAWFIAQTIKVIIDVIRYKSLNTALFVSSGGMPSSHSAFVTALTVMIGFEEGFGSSIFALSAVMSMVVMYDAAGVRRAAGKQAEVLNIILSRAEYKGLPIDKKLKELLGHTPVEVACGALLGIAVALYFVFR